MQTLTINLENTTDAEAVAEFLRETMPEDLRVELQKAITEKLAEVARKEEAYDQLCKELAQHADPAESVTSALARTSRSILKAKPDDPLRLKNLFEHKQRLERWLAEHEEKLSTNLYGTPHDEEDKFLCAKLEEKLHADFDKEAKDGKYTVEQVSNCLRLMDESKSANKWRRAQYEHWLARKDAEKRKEAQEALSAAAQKAEEDKSYRQVCEEMCTLHGNVPEVAQTLLKHAKRGTLYANALHRWLQDQHKANQELEIEQFHVQGKNLSLEEAEAYREVVVSLHEKWPASNKIKCELASAICKINKLATKKAEELELRFTNEFKQKAGGEGRKHVEECLALAERQRAEAEVLVKKYPLNREMCTLLTMARFTVHNWKEVAVRFDEEYKERLALTKACFEEVHRIYQSAVDVANKATFNVIKAKAALEELEKEKS